MNIVDLPDPKRIEKQPDQIKSILSSGNFIQDGITVKKIELRLYVESIDETLGNYSLITSYVETNLGSIEMIYDEGYRGDNSLNRAANFLISNLGISGLVLRSMITLKEYSST